MTSKRSTTVETSTLGDLRTALQELSNAGVPDDAEVRVRTRASFSADGALVRTITVKTSRTDRG
jgi:hypothetical protein